MKKNTISCLLLILLAAAACFTLSCSSGVDVTEADLVLDSFGIVWPAGFDETCVSGVGMSVTINAYDQNGAVFDWSGAVNIVTTNTDVTADPATINLQNGTVQTNLKLISDTGEDLSTSIQLTGGAITTDLGITVLVQVVLPLYNLTVESDGHGTVSPSGTVQVAQGVARDISDVSDTGWVFKNWTVESGDATLGSASRASTTVTLTSGDATVKANHEPGPEINIKVGDTDVESGGSVDFGYLLLGESSEIVFTIENTGEMDLEFTGDPTVSVTGSGDISVTTEPSSSVTPGAETTFTLTFAPELNLLYEETVTIETNDDDEEEYEITVTGGGVQRLAGNENNSAKFGSSIHISGDYLIAGAPNDDAAGADEGAAYVYAWDGAAWNRQAELWASDGAAGDAFGCSVAISEDWAVVGAKSADKVPETNQNTGAVYVFRREGVKWGAGEGSPFTETQKIEENGGAAEDDYFGIAVALYLDRIAVGAQGDNAAGTNTGSVYVYKLDVDTWTEEDQITIVEPPDNDTFGRTVSLWGDYLVAGSYDQASGNEGAAYVYKRDESSWGQQAKLMAGDGAANEYFANAVSIHGDSVLVGSSQHESQTGSAYLFNRNGTDWGDGGDTSNEDVSITASDGESGDYFGSGVSIYGDLALVGAYQDDDNAYYAGAAYVLGRNEGGTENWGEIKKLIAPEPDAASTEESRFGNAVSIGESHFVVGAFNHDIGSNQEGAVYVFPY